MFDRGTNEIIQPKFRFPRHRMHNGMEMDCGPFHRVRGRRTGTIGESRSIQLVRLFFLPIDSAAEFQSFDQPVSPSFLYQCVALSSMLRAHAGYSTTSFYVSRISIPRLICTSPLSFACLCCIVSLTAGNENGCMPSLITQVFHCTILAHSLLLFMPDSAVVQLVASRLTLMSSNSQ